MYILDFNFSQDPPENHLLVTGGLFLKYLIYYCDYNCDDHISISSVFPHFKSSSFHISFLSQVKINLINWSAPNLWVFIAQLVEHCRANVEAMGSNPIEALKIFFGLKFA